MEQVLNEFVEMMYDRWNYKLSILIIIYGKYYWNSIV